MCTHKYSVTVSLYGAGHQVVHRPITTVTIIIIVTVINILFKGIIRNLGKLNYKLLYDLKLQG